jgi:Na+-driven multidrug efflux pump
VAIPLVANALGREDEDNVQNVSKSVLVYSTVLGLFLATILQVGYSTDFSLKFFISDVRTQTALTKILALIIIAQPLNSLVSAADSILQGASEFSFQAKIMALSGATGMLLFVLLQKFLTGDTLAHFWIALIMLQAMRGLASAVKILDKEGPIKLLESTQQQNIALGSAIATR